MVAPTWHKLPFLKPLIEFAMEGAVNGNKAIASGFGSFAAAWLGKLRVVLHSYQFSFFLSFFISFLFFPWIVGSANCFCPLFGLDLILH